jgi:hypothetical protein
LKIHYNASSIKFTIKKYRLDNLNKTTKVNHGHVNHMLNLGYKHFFQWVRSKINLHTLIKSTKGRKFY